MSCSLILKTVLGKRAVADKKCLIGLVRKYLGHLVPETHLLLGSKMDFLHSPEEHTREEPTEFTCVKLLQCLSYKDESY